MPNLNLTYSGNMNITSASIEGNQLKVSYEPNNTGAVSGFSFTPPVGSEFVCGETYTITATPKFRGTVLTENFTVSGVDMAGVQRSDTSTLKQPYDTNLTHYELNLASVGATIISSSVTSDYLELEISIDNDEYAEIDIQPGQGGVIVYPIDNITDGSGPDTGDTGTVASSLTLVVADSITGSGIASAVWSPSGATVSLRYQSNSPAYATIDPVTGEITVLQTGDVRFTVFDDITGLFDSKVVHCYKEGEGPDTGTVINFLAINVPAYIWNTGFVGAQYSPDYAEVDLHYTSNLPAVASVNEHTGQVTVYQTGNVTFCVTDTRSGLSDCMPVNVGIIEPDTGVSATAITINVPDTITDSGLATTTVEPYNADVSLYYTYEDTDIIGANRASIDRYTGQINVRSTGTARFCVEDRYTGLKDCKVVNVVKTPEPEPVIPDDTGWTVPTCETRVVCRYYIPAPSIRQVLGDTVDGSSHIYPRNFERCELEDGTPVLLTGGGPIGNVYDFREPGFHTLCFVLKDKSYIDAGAFRKYVSGAIPITKVYIPEGVKTIGEYAFHFCYDLGEVYLPGTLESIGAYSFFEIPIESITLPQNLKNIGYSAFSSCAKLNTIYSYAAEAPILEEKYGQGPLRYLNEEGVLYYPAGANYSSWFLNKDGYLGYTNYYDWTGEYIQAGSTASALTMNIPDTVVNTGVAAIETFPSNATVSLSYYSSDPHIARIDSNGTITAVSNGEVLISVVDSVSNKSVCRNVAIIASDIPDTGSTESDYLTFTIIIPGTIQWIGNHKTIEYSKNNGEWVNIESKNPTEGISSISVESGDILRFRGNNNEYSGNVFVTSDGASIIVGGNIMSLIYGDSFSGATSFPENTTNNFEELFNNCTGLTDASQLVLPVTGLTENCYEGLFAGCTSLVAAPQLPATTLASYCYLMMFAGCENLTTAPDLLAPVLSNNSYWGMFMYCSKLNYVKCLATDISAASCTSNWLQDVNTTGTFIKSSSMTNWTTGKNGIPSGWTVQNAS